MKFMIVMFLTTLACAANAAWISGTVSDLSGEPIEGAVVSIEGTNLKVVTDSQGRYRIEKLPSKRVELRVSSSKHVHQSQIFTFVNKDHVENFVLAPTHTDNMVITADSLESSALDTVVPVTVLAGERLNREQAGTVGEMLKHTTGVHSSYFGPVAASPIIRGSDGPRVKIVQNGLDSSDVSRVGQDHAVAIDTATASQIEVLRGPATLQFGDGAIGGVVNIVDNRIPRQLQTKKIQGQLELRTDTASNERYGTFNLTGGSAGWAYQLGGFSRKTDDLEIPGFAEVNPEDGEASGILSNSSTDTDSATAGLSWSGSNVFFGVSAQKLDNVYGVPGHGHHEESGHEEGHGDGEMEAASVFIDMGLERYQMHGDWFAPFAGIQKLSLDSGYTDYRHLELENGATGTTFGSKTFENRLYFNHEPILGWEGVLGIHQSQNDYAAVGDEAFTPPSKTESLAVYIAEERNFQNFRFQMGARFNHSDITPEGVARIELGHEEDHHHDVPWARLKNEDSHEEEVFELDRQSFQSFSVSTGLNWNYAEGQSIALVLTRAERAPSTPELFSSGAHLATSTYELGAVFSLDEDGEVLFQPTQVNTELSTGVDLTMRKFDGRWGYSISAFYNRVNDYFYQQNTGFVFEDRHDDHQPHGKTEEDDHHEEEAGLPVLIFRQDDARLYGLEAELHAQFGQNWSGRIFGDGVRTVLETPQNGSRNLPRLPPLRLGADFDFNHGAWSADLGFVWYDDQTRVAAFETTTSGYTLINAGINYRHELSKLNLIGFLRGRNLADEEARVHTSFIKDQAPLPGRTIIAGLRVEF